MYDGIHYDSLSRSMDDTPSNSDETMLLSSDNTAWDESKAIARELKERTQFVDLAGFDLKCMVCGNGINGQTGAQDHARTTGHTNFGQV